MIVTGSKKILQSDIPGMDPWFESVLSPLNTFMTTVMTALRTKLTFRDNFLAQVKELTFVHNVEKKISYTGLNDANGILIVRTPEKDDADYSITGWRTRRISTGIIGVTISFAGAGTIEGKVKFIVLG